MSCPSLVTIPDSLLPACRALAKLPPFLETLYLFTANDFATFAIPTTLFATFGSLSGSVLTTNTSPSFFAVLSRIPLALLVVWANLLLFNISNQRSPIAVEEDKINKPHRPLPSGRTTCDGARRILLILVPLVILLGWTLDVWQETLLLLAGSWMYNDLGGSDENWILRNALIAFGYGMYSSAALRVMAGSDHMMTRKGVEWVVAVTAIMFATQHICDIKDAEGDRARGRRSAPIVLGDTLVRWSVAVPIVVTSIACPAFFSLGPISYTTTIAFGVLVAIRNLVLRDLKSDKLTWKLWALWTCGLFVLPLVKNPVALPEALRDAKACFCVGNNCSGALNLAAVSGVALVVEGRRVFAQMGAAAQQNGTVPEIVVDAVVG